MRTIALVLIAALVVLLGGIAFIYSGLYDVAATDLHWPVTRWAMETARVRSIKAHAAGIAVPPGLDDPAKIQMGSKHFAAHCAVCHGAPGVPHGEIAEGLSRRRPISLSRRRYSDAELFWILKHGIKMTGMPAWRDHTDEELWATVAFIKKLPGMSEQDYARLVMANIKSSVMHHHGGAQAMPDMEDSHQQGHAAPITQPKPRVQDAHNHP